MESKHEGSKESEDPKHRAGTTEREAGVERGCPGRAGTVCGAGLFSSPESPKKEKKEVNSCSTHIPQFGKRFF
jgi:hypothetical protein